MKGEVLDDIDKRLLKLLLEDGRLSYNELGERLGISASTAFSRVKRMMDSKIIKKFAPVIDPEKLGADMAVIIMVKGKGGHLEALERKFSEMQNVYAVYDITGDWDVMLLARFSSRLELNTFVKKLISLPYVEHTCTYTVLNTEKEELSSASIL